MGLIWFNMDDSTVIHTSSLIYMYKYIYVSLTFTNTLCIYNNDNVVSYTYVSRHTTV